MIFAMDGGRWVATLTGLLVGLPATLLACQSDPVAAPPQPPPNVVFIYVDDLGWSDPACLGSRFYETPHVDRLAQEGTVFTAAYANAPNCAPSRACLMSGQYPPRHGVYTVDKSARGKSKHRRIIPIKNTTTLAAEVVTLPESLQEAGYACGHFGKWHLGVDETGPLDQGFDVNVGGNRRGAPARYFSPYKNPDVPDGPEGESLTERLTAEACAFIEANRERPFFVYLTHYAVHTPIQARPERAARFVTREPDRGHQNPKYAAMLATVDDGVGRILDTLHEHGLEERTLVVFYSDNGGHGGATSNRPLRGSKGMLYEGGIRVPLIVRWPGTVKAGRRCDVPVIGVDFYPTLVELAGHSPPEGQPLDGVSLAPLLRGGDQLDRDALYWHFPAYLEGQRKGARDTRFRTRPAGAVRAGNWKLIEYFEDGDVELFDLGQDLGETTDLAEQEPARRDQLRARLHAWRERLDAPVPHQPNPDYQPGSG